jgi:hypothetical protein
MSLLSFVHSGEVVGGLLCRCLIVGLRARNDAQAARSTTARTYTTPPSSN